MPRTLDRKPSDDSNSREKKEKVSENKYKYYSVDEMLDDRNFYKSIEDYDKVEEIDFQLRLRLIN
jgi:hypothetical protein